MTKTFVVGCVLLLMAVSPVLYYAIEHWKKSQRTNGEIARNLATGLWRVFGKPLERTDEGYVVVRVESMSRDLEFGFEALMIKQEDSNFKQARRLEDGDIIRFEMLSDNNDCAFKDDLLEHLRMERVAWQTYQDDH